VKKLSLKLYKDTSLSEQMFVKEYVHTHLQLLPLRSAKLQSTGKRKKGNTQSLLMLCNVSNGRKMKYSCIKTHFYGAMQFIETMTYRHNLRDYKRNVRPSRRSITSVRNDELVIRSYLCYLEHKNKICEQYKINRNRAMF